MIYRTAIVVFIFNALYVCAFDWDEPTELDFYVHADDGYFQWQELAMYEYDGVDLYLVNMTSQKWMDETFSKNSVWWHIMGIAIPHDIEFEDAGFLGIKGGNMDDGISGEDSIENRVTVWAANTSKTVVAYINQIPNQPDVFVNDPEQANKREDNWIAWTWYEAYQTNGTIKQMLARFPMTKAAKRGLDTMNEFVLQKLGNNITRFQVGGASKRGWTTWSLAAMDRRVVSITPLVFSLLNMADTLMHHYRTMDGAWSFAFGPYWNVNLTLLLLDPLADLLYDYEDMYRYRERLTMPKLVISAAGDEFFFLSDSHHWWNDMEGEIFMMMNPNAEHTLFPHWKAIADNVVAFCISVFRGEERPIVLWERTQIDGGGCIVLRTNTEPTKVVAFRANSFSNHTRRDFRLAVKAEDGGIEPQAVTWNRRNVTEIEDPKGEGYFAYEFIEAEVEGVWTGQFIQVEFEGPNGIDFRFTSEVNVIPDTFPRDACTTGEECYGYLV